MPRVLLIRPLEDALPLAEILRAKGLEPCLYPLFKPSFLPLPPLKDPQGLIITSKNALRAIEAHSNLKELPLYVVGDATAELAHKLGFLNVSSASGTAQDLTQLMAQKVQPGEGTLWYLSGDVIKSHIVEDLTSKGFQVKRQIVYLIQEIEDVPLSLHSDLQNNKISHVMFFSPQTTTLFVNFLKNNELEKTTCQMTSLCLSHDVVEKILPLRWKKIWVSPQPTSQNMVDYFDEEK